MGDFIVPPDAHIWLHDLFSYWKSKRDRLGRIPSRRDVDPVDIPHILPGMFLLQIEREGRKFRYRYRLLGSSHRDRNGREFTGKYVDEFPLKPAARRVSDALREVALTGRPNYRIFPIPLEERNFLSYERLALPLSEQGDQVDMILGVAHFLDPDEKRIGFP